MRHTWSRAPAITIESILSIVIFLGKFFTKVVSHCLTQKGSDYKSSKIASKIFAATRA